MTAVTGSAEQAAAISLCVALFIGLLMLAVKRMPDRESYLGTSVGE